MKASGKKGKNRIFMAIVIVICMAAAFVVCAAKSGYHEDEYYSFYSSNRTDGLWVTDDTVLDRQTILDEFSVIKGAGYNFGLVKTVQSWDVHPPIYYFVLHFICSLTPEIFSKWQGLAINLVSFLICILLMYQLGAMLLPEHKELASLTALVWGLSAATLTGLVFIRMYMLLTVWILLVTILHVRAKDRLDFYIALGVITFLGFMTHYYFFIWLFFLAVGFNISAIARTGKWWITLKYGVVMIVTFALCYLFYPVFPAQMFTGQRGAQATGNFFDLSNTWSRIRFFAEKVNRIGFGGLLWVYLVIALVVVIAAAARTKPTIEDAKKIITDLTGKIDTEAIKKALAGGGRSGKSGGKTRPRVQKYEIDRKDVQKILTAAVILYFLAVTKTALMLGDSSIRYQMPVIGVAYILLVLVLEQAMVRGFGKNALTPTRITGGLLLLLLISNVIGDCTGNISFLYPEEKDHIEILNEYSDAQLVYAYDEGQSWCVWDATEELLTHKDVYMMDANSENELTNIAVTKQAKIILFVDNTVDSEAVMDKIEEAAPDISTFTYLYSDEYCDVYVSE